jgi:NAD(P)-dependent dehydrogenase (short-subunit alcohol dehydrogenase family)
MVRAISETTILITGATDGLGLALARRLAAQGATLLLHGRNRQRLDETAEQVRAAGATAVRTYLADFSSLAEVRRLATEVEATAAQLHVLVNNAGIGSGRPERTTRQESRDGHELRFAVNYLAGFLLTTLLLPLLRRSAPARIINVASIGQSPIDFDDVMLERNYSGVRAYGQSKLAQIMFGMALAERLPPNEVTVNSLHPATYMPTKIVLEEIGRTVDRLEDGVEATARLAISPELEGVSGRFFNRTTEAQAHPQAYDPNARRRLWELSERLTKSGDVTN